MRLLPIMIIHLYFDDPLAFYIAIATIVTL